MDDGRLLVSIRTLPSCGLGQSRVGCTEQSGDALPREMTAQVEQSTGQNAAYRPAWSFGGFVDIQGLYDLLAEHMIKL